ncbi:MAG: cyclic nucleotide-binding domain-containing protein [Azospirillum sp.]|nr:cyclic nucleotide-binding domain-containing protein [Azospirillum sp.]
MFADIEPAKLKLLAFTSEQVVFQAGETLFRQSEPGDAAYLIIEGAVEIIADTPAGSFILNRIERNEVVGETAILCNSPRTATVRAATPLTTLRISRDQFFELINEFPTMAVAIMQVLAQRLVHTTDMLRQATIKLPKSE